MASPVTAASYPGVAPGTSILMPDDGDKRLAAWIRALAALVLANDDYLFGQFAALLAANNTWTGLNTFNGAVETNSTLQVDGAATLNSTTEFNGAAQFDGNVTVDAAITPVFSSAKTYTRAVDTPPLYDAAQWTIQTDGESLVPVYSSATISAGTTEIVWAFRPPSAATVTAVSVYLTPSTVPTHGGVPVVTLAAAKLLRADTGAANAASTTDGAGSVGAYETPHELALTGLSLTFAEGDLLLIRLSPETGGDAETGLKVGAPIVTFTRARLAEE
jgi:hypothetical protein